MSVKRKVITVILSLGLAVCIYGAAYAHGLRTAGDMDHIMAEMLTINPEASDPRLVQAAVLANIVKNIDDPKLDEMYQEMITDFIKFIENNWDIDGD